MLAGKIVQWARLEKATLGHGPCAIMQPCRHCFIPWRAGDLFWPGLPGAVGGELVNEKFAA
jgi:hypothetical protein